MKDNKVNAFPYYISQFFWLFYLLIPMLFAILFPKKTKKIQIYSSTALFNNSIDPILFSHVTDTHINSLRPSSVDSFRKTFNLLKIFYPEFVVLTGDIVDNYDSTSHPRYGEQSEENWKIYQEETKNFSDIPIIEVGGNHDMFGIKNVFSQKNYLIDSSHSFNRINTKTEDDFLVHSFRVGPSKTNVIAINPFQFPTSHPPLLLYTTFSSHLLDLIHNEIDKSESKSIVICHYPIGSIHSMKSSNGYKFTDMISWKDKILCFLSGHSHPKSPQLFHHSTGSLEILGTASFQYSSFGLVTIDNDGISWSTVDFENPPKGVITYPIPKEQISANTIFNNKETAEIRVMMFSNRTDLSISFTITENQRNIYSGDLIYSRPLINGHSLYTFPLNKCIKNNGLYQITFSGDFDGFSEFVINNTYETGEEELTEYPGIVEMLFITFFVFLTILLIITTILPLNCFKCQSKLDEVEEWIETSKTKANLSNWLLVIFGGFLIVRTRIQKNPLFIRIFLFCSVIFGVFGPLLFFKTEEMFGYIFSYGYFINNRFFFADYGILYSYFFLGIVCTPMIIISSGFGVIEWSIRQLGDVIFYCCSIIGDVIVLIRIVHQTVGSDLTAASIGFLFIPISFIVMVSTWKLIERKKKIKSLQSELMANITEDSLAQNFNSFSSSSSA